MAQVTLANILYSVIAFSWIVYIVQELFVAGASALNIALSKDEAERKQIQVTTGLHFDGMEVWLIAALTITFGSFPLVFGTTLTYLYVPFFLLLYTIIARGISIEVLYKMDDPKWTKVMAITWMVSSVLLIFIIGLFLTNMFYGFPMDSTGLTGSFLSVFNVTGISGALLFVVMALLSGAGWISITTEGPLSEKAVLFVKKYGVIYAAPILILLVFMGFNNLDNSIFIGQLFSQSFLYFVLPIGTVTLALLAVYYGQKEDGKKLFIFVSLTALLFMLTGFVGIYPYMIPSNIAISDGITLFDAMVSQKTMSLIATVLAIFYPIIIGYQSWKYLQFRGKIRRNDEEAQ